MGGFLLFVGIFFGAHWSWILQILSWVQGSSGSNVDWHHCLNSTGLQAVSYLQEVLPSHLAFLLTQGKENLDQYKVDPSNRDRL